MAVEAAHFEPFPKRRIPAFIVGSGGEFRYVVGGRIRFDSRNFPEVVDGVRGVGRTAADSEDKEPSAARADGDEFLDALFAVGRVDPGGDLGGFLEVLDGVGHG